MRTFMIFWLAGKPKGNACGATEQVSHRAWAMRVIFMFIANLSEKRYPVAGCAGSCSIWAQESGAPFRPQLGSSGINEAMAESHVRRGKAESGPGMRDLLFLRFDLTHPRIETNARKAGDAQSCLATRVEADDAVSLRSLSLARA